MSSFCPACGTPASPDADARFCARCGRELPGAPAGQTGPVPVPPPPPGAPPAVPPQAPPAAPPTLPGVLPAQPGAAHPQAPAGPSPAGQFLRRTFSGRWDVPAVAALVPALCFVVLAVVIGVWTGAAVDDPGVGFVTRTRIALGVLLTGVGATVRLSTRVNGYGDGDVSFGDSGDSGDGFGDSGDSGYGDGYVFTSAHSTISVIALLMTLLWVGALVLALRRSRARLAPGGGSAGAEAAVRVALAAAAAALVLGLVAQPAAGDVHMSTGPVLLTLWAFLISLATALLTLCSADVGRWLAARPGPAAVAGALRTALIALLITVALGGFVVFVVVGTHADQTTGWGVAFAALFLPNLGVSGLGLGWGAPFHLSASGSSSDYGGHYSFGLGELGHIWQGWAAVGAVAGGVVCALVIGVLAVRRSADRREQFLVAGVFTGLFVLLTAVGGVSQDGSTSGFTGLAAAAGHTSASTSVPEALMFALLWTCGGVFVAPYVWRALGGTVPAPRPRAVAGAAAAPYGPPPGQPQAGAGGPSQPQPYVPAQPPSQPQPQPPSQPEPRPYDQPTVPEQQTVHDLGVVQPPRLNKPPDHR
jgi:hypothetical protein